MSASSGNGDRGGAGGGRGGRGSLGGGERFSWDKDALTRDVKNLLSERAEDTVRHYWAETNGDLYAEWLDNFTKAQRQEFKVDDVMGALGWGRHLLNMMYAEPVEAVVVRTAKKDSQQVIEAQKKNNERPVTVAPWRHTMNQLSADWDKEEEEEMKVALDHPPQLKAVNKTVVMQPVDIAKHIMAIREQLSAEWHEDLGNVEVASQGPSAKPTVHARGA